jgi:hypothetical protein
VPVVVCADSGARANMTRANRLDNFKPPRIVNMGTKLFDMELPF